MKINELFPIVSINFEGSRRDSRQRLDFKNSGGNAEFYPTAQNIYINKIAVKASFWNPKR